MLEAREVPALFTVNNPIDIVVPGLTNLRQAIDQANAAAGADTINFAAALHFVGSGTALSPVYDTLPTITDDLTIDGTSGVAGQRANILPAPVPVPQGEGMPPNPPPQFRLFRITTPAALLPLRVEVFFNGLTISGGSASDPADPNGGAIAMVNATVTLDNCIVTGNRAHGDGGALWATGNPSLLTLTSNSVVANNTAGGNGGGIAVTNTSLKLDVGTQVVSNTAGLGGGGIAAFADGYVGIPGRPFLKLDGSQGLVSVNGNTALNGDGGGVLVQESNTGAAWPDVIFDDTSVNSNTARGTAPPAGADWTSGRGGGVAVTGFVTVDSDTNTIVTGNKQSAPAPTTAPFKLGVYLDTPLILISTFPTNANVFDNEQLP